MEVRKGSVDSLVQYIKLLCVFQWVKHVEVVVLLAMATWK